jgi:phage shock protein PspC (stress-responsive transcriptional regulator)
VRLRARRRTLRPAAGRRAVAGVAAGVAATVQADA